MPALRPAQRNRTWCFTINNPTEQELSDVKGLFPETAKWMVVQKEKGEAETPHLQGVVGFTSPKSLTACKALLPRAHLEVCRDAKASVAYCSKEEGRLDGPWKLGNCPKPGKRSDLEEIKTKILSGSSEREIANDHFGTWCRSYKAFERFRNLNMERRSWKTQVVVLWGATGT